jgi:hypothetical protein
MDRETALRIWSEVPGLANVVTGRSLEEFATRIEQLEREACAKVCDDLWQEEATAAANGDQNPKYHDCIECAHAIRERSNVEVSGLRGFSRRSARLPGWASVLSTGNWRTESAWPLATHQ